MSYIGRGTDKISNIEILDNITFDGSSSYSITKSSVAFTPNSAQSLLISIDGVVQATNFTVSSSTIDFGVAIPSTSTCDFFLHYGTGLITIPADGTVSLDKLSATGTKDATTFLRGDNTFQTVTSYADSDALSLFNVTGSAPVYACRAWVNFNGGGTPAIRSSGNVSSITDNGTGNFTVNFTTAMPDTEYATICSIGNYTANDTTWHDAGVNNNATGNVTVRAVNGANNATDATSINVAIFR